MNPDGRFAPATIMQTQLQIESFTPSVPNTSWPPNSQQPFPNETQNTSDPYPAAVPGTIPPYPTGHFSGSYDSTVSNQTYNTRGSAIGEQMGLPNVYSESGQSRPLTTSSSDGPFAPFTHYGPNESSFIVDCDPMDMAANLTVGGHTQAYPNPASMLDPSSTITGPSEIPMNFENSFAVNDNNYNPWTAAPFNFGHDGNQSSY
jgi:hypothetical protein